MSAVLMMAAGGIAYAGLTALCAGFDRHYRQLRPSKPGLSPVQHLLFRTSGWLLLGLSLWISVRAWGPGIGWVAWFGILSGMTVLLVLQLTYTPRRPLLFAPMLGALSLLMTIAAGLAP